MAQPSPWNSDPRGEPHARDSSAPRDATEQERGDAPMPPANVALEALLTEIADLRPLPQVAQRILGLDEGKFSAHQLAAIIATDQALTAKLLRLANAPYYGFARRITTARDAVVLLGFRAVRGAALASCLMQTAQTRSHLDHEAFWQHSIATGVLAEMLARTEGVHQEEAFTAGLLHQIGLLALDQARPAALDASLALRQQGLTMHEAEQQVLGFTDAELGEALALQWNFPPSLAAAVRGHAQALDTLPDPRSLTAFVLRARMLVRAHGLADGLTPASAPAEPPEEWARPPLSAALRQGGGMAKVMEQVEALAGSLA